MLHLIRRFWIIIVLLLIIGGFFLYQRQKTLTEAEKDTTYTVKRQTLEESLSLSGSVDAGEKAVLRFQGGGRVAWVGVREGDYVSQYQGIASLDTRETHKRLKRYLELYENARVEFDQSQEDTREVVIGGLTRDQRNRALRAFQQDQNNLDISVIDVELQSIAGEDAYLFAPIPGLVVQAEPAYMGIDTGPTTSNYTIINPDTVFFSASADQTDVVKIKHGMEGKIILDAYPDNELSGSVSSIAFTPETDESGTVYEVKVAFPADNGAFNYKLGMTGDINFVLNKKARALAVPNRHITTRAGKKYVMKLVNGKKEETEIKTGISFDTDVEILYGLREGDVIVEE